MSFNIRSAIDCLKSQIKDGEFNAIAILDYLSHESHFWVGNLDQMWVSTSLIKNYKTAYEFKNQLWEEIKTKFEFNGDYLAPGFLKHFTMSDLKDFTSKSNLFSALLEYTKEKVRDILYDIDNDVLEYVLNTIKEKMENENE